MMGLTVAGLALRMVSWTGARSSMMGRTCVRFESKTTLPHSLSEVLSAEIRVSVSVCK